MKKLNIKTRSKLLWGMTKLNIKKSWIAYAILGAAIALMLILAVKDMYDYVSLTGVGQVFYIFPLLLAIFIPALHYKKFLNLGAKKLDFFWSCIFIYVIAAIAAALLGRLAYYAFDKPLLSAQQRLIRSAWPPETIEMYDKEGYQISYLSDMFNELGFKGATGFFQMFALIFFFTCMVHTLTLIQGKWYGWVADVFVVFWFFILPPLYDFESIKVMIKWFYDLIIFHKYPAVQILGCLALGAGIYMLSLFPIKKKGY